MESCSSPRFLVQVLGSEGAIVRQSFRPGCYSKTVLLLAWRRLRSLVGSVAVRP